MISIYHNGLGINEIQPYTWQSARTHLRVIRRDFQGIWDFTFLIKNQDALK